MEELLRAKRELLSLEMETVSLLGRTASNDSPKSIAAQERQLELHREISQLRVHLSEINPDTSED